MCLAFLYIQGTFHFFLTISVTLSILMSFIDRVRLNTSQKTLEVVTFMFWLKFPTACEQLKQELIPPGKTTVKTYTITTQEPSIYLCHVMGGIPPPSRGIVGKNRSTRRKTTVRSKRVYLWTGCRVSFYNQYLYTTTMLHPSMELLLIQCLNN